MSASIAGGTERTFLATDVAGSTALHRRYPDDMLAAMDLHDQILHAAIRGRHGDPFKNTGDGVFAVFERPVDAVLAAIDAQREMRRVTWGPTGRLLMRCGVHTGVARPRGSDFFGPALPTVNRLETAANADQILVSSATAERLAAGKFQVQFELADLGEHHFKGIEAIRVYQVCAADLPRSFPPIGGKRETATGNLPATLNSFIGRERELNELVQLTGESRMLTLVGPGGIGKTRLAIELARSLESSFPDGAWLVDLSALERGSEVWPAIAGALLIEPVPGVQRRIQVLERLHNARSILLMDNCEHVIDQIADAVLQLGSSCAALYLVNTSRHTLGVEGEALYEVAALASGSEEGHAQSAAVRLFIDRGRLVDRRFQASPDDLVAIQAICANLEHIPLAIEIAAGQLRRLTVAKIAQGVVNPLDLRSARLQRGTGRQQTLRHTLEWSYDLLDPNSRQVLQRLAVFSGPFHEEQGLAVCVGDIPNESDVLDGIAELVESSLLARDLGGPQLFRMLQTVQAFGREKLDEAGLLEVVEHRHGEVFAARCRELGRQIASDKEANAVHAIFDELGNLRSAFERALTRDLKLAAELAASLFLFNYSQRGAETGDWSQRIMARPAADELERAPILLAAAAVHAFHAEGDWKNAAVFIERGFKAEAAGRESSGGWLSGVAGQMAQWSKDTAKCISYLLAAAEQARTVGNAACEITSLCMAAYVMARAGDIAGAEKLVREVTRIGQTTVQPTLLGYVHYARGRLESFRDPLRAIEEYQISVEWANMAGNHLGAHRVKHFIAELQAPKGEPAVALSILVRALMDLPKHGTTFYAWSSIRSCLLPLAQLGADEHLAVVAGALQGSPVKLGRKVQSAVNESRARLGEDAFDLSTARGSHFDLAQARAYLADVAGRIAQPSCGIVASTDHGDKR